MIEGWICRNKNALNVEVCLPVKKILVPVGVLAYQNYQRIR